MEHSLQQRMQTIVGKWKIWVLLQPAVTVRRKAALVPRWTKAEEGGIPEQKDQGGPFWGDSIQVEDEQWGKSFPGRGNAGVTAQAQREERAGLTWGAERGPRRLELLHKSRAAGHACEMWVGMARSHKVLQTSVRSSFLFSFPFKQRRKWTKVWLK